MVTKLKANNPNEENYLPYTGIGSRSTPKPILQHMAKIARTLQLQGFTLRSGGASGADTAFEKGVAQNFDAQKLDGSSNKDEGNKEIYLPHKNFNENSSSLFNPNRKAYEMAEAIHPHWQKCSKFARNAHARNIHQILGENLNSPSLFVLYWAEEKHKINPITNPINKTPKIEQTIVGGTATAVKLAKSLRIPTFNLKDPQILKRWNEWVKECEEKSNWKASKNSLNKFLEKLSVYNKKTREKSTKKEIGKSFLI